MMDHGSATHTSRTGPWKSHHHCIPTERNDCHIQACLSQRKADLGPSACWGSEYCRLTWWVLKGKALCWLADASRKAVSFSVFLEMIKNDRLYFMVCVCSVSGAQEECHFNNDILSSTHSSLKSSVSQGTKALTRPVGNGTDRPPPTPTPKMQVPE